MNDIHSYVTVSTENAASPKFTRSKNSRSSLFRIIQMIIIVHVSHSNDYHHIHNLPRAALRRVLPRRRAPKECGAQRLWGAVTASWVFLVFALEFCYTKGDKTLVKVDST